jgi:GNAT superfamily N-acetyltransferase
MRPTRVRKPAGKAAADLDRLAFKPVTPSTRGDFEAFFSSPGAPHYCWCVVWRRSSEEAKHHAPADRKRQMMQRLDRGTPVGLLAYLDGAPVGWVSIAPRETYRNLGGPAPKEGEVIWSLACFFVRRSLRGQGMTRRLIAAAVDYAREEGATIVEAYPVDEAAPSYRFMGFVPVFRKAGFTEVARAGTRRHAMRLPVGQAITGRPAASPTSGHIR